MRSAACLQTPYWLVDRDSFPKRLFAQCMQHGIQAANSLWRVSKFRRRFLLLSSSVLPANSVANGPLGGSGMIAQHGPGSTLGASVNLGSGGADINAEDTRPLVVSNPDVSALCPYELQDRSVYHD